MEWAGPLAVGRSAVTLLNHELELDFRRLELLKMKTSRLLSYRLTGRFDLMRDCMARLNDYQRGFDNRLHIRLVSRLQTSFCRS